MSPDEYQHLLHPPSPVLDFHTHPLDGIGPYQVNSPAEDAARIIESARRARVDRACVFSLYRTMPREPSMDQCRQANDYALRLRDQAPEFFLPFAYATPTHPEASVREIQRCVSGEGMVGIKLWVALRATDPRLDPILAQAVELDVPVLQHAWRKTLGQLPGESRPADVADLARRHPQARIVMAHLNGINPRGLEAVADCPNVAVDTAGGDPESNMVELAARRLGPGRVVFGSDMPIRHFGISLAKVLGADLPMATRRDILWNNAARILPARAGINPLKEEDNGQN